MSNTPSEENIALERVIGFARALRTPSTRIKAFKNVFQLAGKWSLAGLGLTTTYATGQIAALGFEDAVLNKWHVWVLSITIIGLCPIALTLAVAAIQAIAFVALLPIWLLIEVVGERGRRLARLAMATTFAIAVLVAIALSGFESATSSKKTVKSPEPGTTPITSNTTTGTRYLWSGWRCVE